MIRERNGRWGVRVYEHGRWRWVGTFPTAKQARRAEAQAMVEEAREVQTVAEYAAVWLEGYEHRVKRSSYQRARSAVSRITKHALGDEPIGSISLATAERFSRQEAASLQTAVAILNHAIARGAARLNPLKGLSRKGPGRKYLAPLTVDQVASLASQARQSHDEPFGTTLSAFLTVAAYSGMRPGELYALEQRDIDRETNRIMVRRRVHQGHVDLPKSGRQREISLLPEAADALDLLPKRGEGLVFTAKRGGRLSESLMSGNYWPPVRALYGRKVDVYELRHFCGHHLYVTLGLPARVVAAQLGHSSPRLVEDLYGHGDVGALEEIDRAVGRTRAPLRVVSGRDGDAEEVL